jgi:hypothetical protein
VLQNVHAWGQTHFHNHKMGTVMNTIWCCHPLIWGINLFGCTGGILFVFIFLLDSIEKEWGLGIFAALLIILFLFCHILYMPRKVQISNDRLIISWPWRAYVIHRERVRSIFIRQYWLKTVHIIIRQDTHFILSLIPFLLSWELQSEDDPNIASHIEIWWRGETAGTEPAVLTNREVSVHRMWTKSERRN